MGLRILHAGDFHLGAQLRSLPPETAAAVRASTRKAVEGIFAAVAERDIALVALTGDLFEQNGDDPAGQLRFIYQLAESVAPVPVVITPGNHDPVFADSPYSTMAWPQNVVLFNDGRFSVRSTPAGPVAGRAVMAGEGTGALDWSLLPVPGDGASLLVLHASLMRAGDGRRNRNTVAPVTIETLRNCGYAYVALGHYHRYQGWDHPGGGVLAAYAGCPQGQGWDEPGEKGCLAVDIEPEGAKVDQLILSDRVWHRANLTLPPEHAPDADTRILTGLQEIYDKLDGQDLLRLAVHGRWPRDARAALEDRIADVTKRAWYAEAVDFSGVDFHPPLVAPGQSEVLDSFSEICEAGAAAAADDAGEQAAWQLAHYLGRRLLSGQGLPEEVA